MTDPAVAAAQQALADMPNLAEQCAAQPILNALVVDVGCAAAREALKPIRDVVEHHRALGIQVISLRALAPLAYPTEEL